MFSVSHARNLAILVYLLIYYEPLSLFHINDFRHSPIFWVPCFVVFYLEFRSILHPTTAWNINMFEIGKRIGKGSNGKVYVAREKTSKFIVALKKIKKSHLNKSYREIKIQASLR